MQPRNNRIALILFAVYLVLYCGFVFLNAFAPAAMEATPLAGVNLAVLYGFGLIVAAFVLALLYGWLAVTPTRAGISPAGQNARAADAACVPRERSAGTHGPTGDHT